ncbi:hypothetical protein [Amycolatopsis sp. WQ 127309]|uniref:hypothetical protein n=1 Tax=Amycolatopsis sp. WQ 127309 TaxID=2932773 RepID=UPI001FF3BFB7|nr:hypothetical protein [Amycolatopsis sp. WQ 127309]UOZ12056.1 hypothetical protein MUY22_28895 [Amycolatopsis sp. WQ 127309]
MTQSVTPSPRISNSSDVQSGLDEGWDIFELYSTRNPATGNAYYCADARGAVFESGSLRLRAHRAVGGGVGDELAAAAHREPAARRLRLLDAAVRGAVAEQHLARDRLRPG